MHVFSNHVWGCQGKQLHLALQCRNMAQKADGQPFSINYLSQIPTLILSWGSILNPYVDSKRSRLLISIVPANKYVMEAGINRTVEGILTAVVASFNLLQAG